MNKKQLLNVIRATKFDVLKKKYPKHAKDIAKIEKADPTKGKHYLGWGVDRLLEKEPVAEIISLMLQFHKEKSKLKVKDLSKYKRLADLRDAFEQKAAKKKQKVVDKGSYEILHDDDRWLVINPKDMKASCFFGRGAKWCISSTMSENYFGEYARANTHFYFVIDKEAKPKSTYSKLAVPLKKGKRKPEEVFDAKDREMSYQKFEKLVPPFVFAAIVKRHGRQVDTPHFAAASEKTPPATLAKLAKTGDRSMRESIAYNRKAPAATLKMLSKDPDDEVRRGVAGNWNAPGAVLDELADDESVVVRIDVAENASGNVSREAFKKLAEDKKAGVQAAAARNEKFPADLLEETIDKAGVPFKNGVARNPRAPEYVLEKLVDEDDTPRTYVALNKALTPALAKRLYDTGSKSVRVNLAKNKATPPTILADLYEDDMGDGGHGDGQTSFHIAQNPNTPTAILLKMLETKDDDLIAEVASNPNTPGEELIKLAKESEDVGILEEIAKNRMTPVEALEVLADVDDEDVLENLINNPATTKEILQRLLETTQWDYIKEAVQRRLKRDG